jgi:hypothetical protein
MQKANAGLSGLLFIAAALWILSVLGMTPVFLKGVTGYAAPAAGVAVIGMQIGAAMGATGAFELLDEKGNVLYSKLQTGRMPRLEDLVAKVRSM